MALKDILQTVIGVWEPIGAYSFEFRKTKSGKKIAEIFLLLPPNSISYSEPQQSFITRTLNGGFITDFGSGFKKITISGEAHFKYVGTPGLNRAGSQEIPPNMAVDGWTEWLKIRFMMSRFRDYTLTPNGALRHPAFPNSLVPMAAINSFRIEVLRLLKDDNGALVDQIECVFHDFDMDDHWVIKVDEFTSQQSADDPFTIKYTINAVGYQRTGSSLLEIPIRTRIAANKRNSQEELNKIITRLRQLHPASLPDTLVQERRDNSGRQLATSSQVSGTLLTQSTVGSNVAPFTGGTLPTFPPPSF